MKILSRFITRRPKLILLLFMLLLLGAILLIPKVGVNDNKADYLPSSSEAKQGLVILEDEFKNIALDKHAKVLIKNKQFDEVLVIKNQIKAIQGIENVSWLDDFVDISIPVEMIPDELIKNYYQNGNALIDIKFQEEVDSQLTVDAIESINDLLSESGGVGFTSRSVIEVGNTATIIAIIIIVIIIILFTDSFMSAILMLFTLAVGIILNFGTNIIFGEISDISFMAAAVIQLAVSIDYSLIFLKNFKISRVKFENINESIINANNSSFRTIFASATTTIAGFLALGVMNYQIGAELGLILAKGVLFSFITVSLLLPALMKLGIKFVDKTQHKDLLPSIKWMGKIINGKISIFVLLILIAFTIVGYYGQAHNQFTYSDNQIEHTSVEKDIVNDFGENNAFILLVPKEDKYKEVQLINEINSLENVKSISSLYTFIPVETPDEYIPDLLKNQYTSEKYSLILVIMDLKTESLETFNAIKQIRTLTSNYYYNDYFLTGESSIIYDVKNTVVNDYLLVIVASIIAIALIIVIMFKSIIIPILLLLIIQTAIWINMAVPYYQDAQLAFLGYILISAIQLGATIDYAIIITEHYEEERKLYCPQEAARKAFEYGSQSIIISMMALVVAGFSLTVMMDMDLIKDLGILIGRGTIISGIISLFVLPQLLVLFDKIISKTTYKRKVNLNKQNNKEEKIL